MLQELNRGNERISVGRAAGTVLSDEVELKPSRASGEDEQGGRMSKEGSENGMSKGKDMVSEMTLPTNSTQV